MAILKDLIVNGASRFIGDAYFNTIKAGVWNGTAIDVAHGGTGLTTFSSAGLVYASGTTAFATKTMFDSNISGTTYDAYIPTGKALRLAISAGFAANDAMQFAGSFAGSSTKASNSTALVGTFTTTLGTTPVTGATWRVSSDGYYGNTDTERVETGDLIILINDNFSSKLKANFIVIQKNLNIADYVTKADAQTITGAKTFNAETTFNKLATFNKGLISTSIGDSDNDVLFVSGNSSFNDIVNIYGQTNHGNHVIPMNNNAYDLGSSSLKWRNIYATTFNGNASTATALTTNAGNSKIPVYFSEGKPVSTGYDLSTFLTSASAADMYLPLLGGTLTGALTVKNNGWSNILILNRTSASGSWGPAILFQYDGIANGTLTMTNNLLYVGNSGSNRYKVWHEGNDGDGSGLNADLLDGYHVTNLKTVIRNSKDINVSSGAGWYRILDCTRYSMMFFITFYGSYSHQRPTPVTYLVSHSYDKTVISQIGRSAHVGWIQAIRAVHHDTAKFYIDVKFGVSGSDASNLVAFEVTPMDDRYTSFSLIDYTKQSDGDGDAICNTSTSFNVDYATSAGKATNDSDGNAINSTYVKKTGDSMSGSLSILTLNINKSAPTELQLVINGPTYDANMDVSSLKAWPGIGFHMPNRTYASLIYDGKFKAVSSNFTDYVYFFGAGFLKSGSSNEYVLLGGGGHKAVSDFATSEHNHNSSYVSAVAISGNYLRVTKNGSNSDLTIPYATGSSKLMYHNMINYRTDFDNFSGENAIKVALFQNNGTDDEQLVIPFTDGSLISFPWNTSNNYGAQLAVEDYGQTHHLAIRNRNGVNTWGKWAIILTSANYNLYSPKLDGTGASGTWGINITGSAGKATNDSDGNAINSTYLKNSGGTLTGDLTISKTGGAKFTAKKDANHIVSLYYSTNRGVYDDSRSRWMIYTSTNDSDTTQEHVYIPEWGTKGSSTQPIYMSSGYPTTCTASSVSSSNNLGTVNLFGNKLENIVLKSYIDNLSLYANTTTTSSSIKLYNNTWTLIGNLIVKSLESGTYMVSISTNSSQVASGFFSAIKNTEDYPDGVEEIPLHYCGVESGRFYAGTQKGKFVMSSKAAELSARIYTITFKRII